MQILKFASLPSTSSHAAQLVREGQIAMPFAVWAGEQTEGRGRQGRSWLSPVGGLYLTIVLPKAEGRDPGLDVLRAGVLVARTLEDVFKIRITLKWPNDILWDGKKLGGILCESSILGSEWGPTLVGVGLNVASVSEELGPGADYDPVAIEDIVPGRILDQGLDRTVDQLSARMCDMFHKEWTELSDGDVRGAYGPFALQPGHVAWEMGEGGKPRSPALWWKGISPSGAGRFSRDTAAGDETEIRSISHCPRWSGQQPKGLPRVVCDLGNSNLKWGVFREGQPLVLGRLDHRTWQTDGLAALSSAIAWPQALYPTTQIPVFYGSVRPQLNKLFEEAGRGAGLCATPVEKKMKRVWGKNYELHQLGIDRLAAMEGVLELSRGRRPAQPTDWHLVVSGGTAITWDLVSADGHHHGGLIGAGLGLQLEALARATGQLPDLSVDDCVQTAGEIGKGLPHSTDQAMAGAVLESVRGTRDRLQLVAAQAGCQIVSIWTCGGDAEPLANWLGGRAVPEVILLGLRMMAWG